MSLYVAALAERRHSIQREGKIKRYFDRNPLERWEIQIRGFSRSDMDNGTTVLPDC
jgi:hypothetical protein